MQIHPSDLGLAARVVDLTKTYGTGSGTVTALDNVSVGMRRGQFTAIIGASGSGKSTLMHVMAGLDSPTTGRVWLGDQELSDLGDRELTRVRRRAAGFVFQSFNLVPVLDVRGNILLPFELDGHRGSVDRPAEASAASNVVPSRAAASVRSAGRSEANDRRRWSSKPPAGANAAPGT